MENLRSNEHRLCGSVVVVLERPPVAMSAFGATLEEILGRYGYGVGDLLSGEELERYVYGTDGSPRELLIAMWLDCELTYEEALALSIAREHRCYCAPEEATSFFSERHDVRC